MCESVGENFVALSFESVPKSLSAIGLLAYCLEAVCVNGNVSQHICGKKHEIA